MYKYAFFTAIALFFITSTFAQTDTMQTNRVISFVPQYLFNNGIRVDYEIRLSEKHWLQFAPQIYLRDRTSGDAEYNYQEYHKLYGAGLFLYHKQYMVKKLKPEGAYFSYGLTYNYYYLSYDEEWVNTRLERHNIINKLGADVIIGINTIIFDFLTVDIFAGLGVRYSLLESDAENHKEFNDSYADFGYTGNMMSLGLRLGIIR